MYVRRARESVQSVRPSVRPRVTLSASAIAILVSSGRAPIHGRRADGWTTRAKEKEEQEDRGEENADLSSCSLLG